MEELKIGDRVIPSEQYPASIYYHKDIIGTITGIDDDQCVPIEVRWDDGVTWKSYKPNQLTLVEAVRLHGHPRFYELTKKMEELHSAKNKDYAQGGDALGNFKRVSTMLEAFGIKLTPAQIGFIYLMKQVDAAGRMLFQGYEGETETLDKRLEDMGVYPILIRILYEEG